MYSSDMGYIQLFQPLKETSPEVLLLECVHLFWRSFLLSVASNLIYI